MGIAAAGSLLLMGRLWGAFFDPMMGLTADRTNTRRGKFRPWVLRTALPWGAVMLAAYTTPGFSAGGRIRRRQRAHQPVVVPLRCGDGGAVDGGRLHGCPWVAMFILTLVHFSVLTMRGGTLSYYFQHYVSQDRLYGLRAWLGLANPAATGRGAHF